MQNSIETRGNLCTEFGPPVATVALPPTEVNNKTKQQLINKFLKGSLTRNLNKIGHDNRQTVFA